MQLQERIGYTKTLRRLFAAAQHRKDWQMFLIQAGIQQNIQVTSPEKAIALHLLFDSRWDEFGDTAREHIAHQCGLTLAAANAIHSKGWIVPCQN